MSAPNSGLYQSTNSSTSTLRPRNARLISFLEEDHNASTATSTSTSTTRSKTPPLFPSRGSSPSQGVGRTRSLNKGRVGSDENKHTRTTSLSGASGDLWASWSSIASSLLGSDVSPSPKGKSKAPSKAPKWMKQDHTYSTQPVSPQWGPATRNLPTIVPGSAEERQAMLQAKKREELLLASVAEKQDSSGRFKRRDSDAEIGFNETEDDVLVYMHRIQRQDTLAGVMLKYGCQQEIFRKANRFWPNDNIQTRKHVFLPVEACSIRGKKVDRPVRSELMPSSETITGAEQSNDGVRSSLDTDAVSSPLQSDFAFNNSENNDDGIKHESWAEIPAFQNPVEILRMPRKSLGYFPRARRKSNSFKDESTASTPKSSFDMLRHPPTHAAQISASLNASPVRRPMHLRSGSARQRSSSTTATQSQFVDALHGPGGVGTLSGLRTEASKPGPADDVLNREFARRFPTLAIHSEAPQPLLSVPDRLTPRASTDSVRSTRSNSSGLGDVSGAIEGWMRKMATGKAAKAGAGGRMGDLIELETNSDLGEPILEDDDEQQTPTLESTSRFGSKAHSSATEEEALDERFPIRGRIRNAYSRTS